MNIKITRVLILIFFKASILSLVLVILLAISEINYWGQDSSGSGYWLNPRNINIDSQSEIEIKEGNLQFFTLSEIFTLSDESDRVTVEPDEIDFLNLEIDLMTISFNTKRLISKEIYTYDELKRRLQNEELFGVGFFFRFMKIESSKFNNIQVVQYV